MDGIKQALILIGYFQDLPGPTGKDKVVGAGLSGPHPGDASVWATLET